MYKIIQIIITDEHDIPNRSGDVVYASGKLTECKPSDLEDALAMLGLSDYIIEN